MNKKLICLLLSLVLAVSFAVGAQASEDTAGVMKLTADAEGLVINEDMLLDLNGFDVTNAVVAEGVTLQLMDSANDTYDAGKCGSFSGTVNGTVSQLVEQEGKSYLVINQDGVYSAHRFYAGITHISLKPDAVALGYKATYRADSVINEMVSGYGYAMWLNEFNPVSCMKTGSIEKQTLTLRLNNILRENNDEMNAIGVAAEIGGKAVIHFNVDGAELIVEGAEYKTTLQQAVEAVNAALGADRSAYTQAQLDSVKAMYYKFETYMQSWQTEHILAENKFNAITAPSVVYGESVTLGQLFASVEGATIGEVEVTVSGVDYAITANADWTQTAITFNGVGTAVITVTDNDRCLSASNSVQIAKADPQVPEVGTLTATYGDDLATVALPEGFTWVSTGKVGNVGTSSFTAIYNNGDANYNTVEVAVSVEVAKADPEVPTVGTLNATYGDDLSTVALPEGFTWVSTGKVGNVGTNSFTTVYNNGDANYNTVEVAVSVEVAKANPEYTVPTGLTTTEGDELSTVALPDGFAWVDGNATVALGENTYAAIFTPDDSNNYNTVTVQITVTGEAKAVEIVDKFAVALYEGEPAFLYRVGNLNTVALSSLFKALDGVEIGTVSIEIKTLSGDAAGTYTANNTWTAGTIKFSGTGVVEVIISDETSNTCSVKLEVVTAKNITKAESATANNVVLLNDISGSFVVSNGNTFYGNGFTVTLPNTSVMNKGNGFTGYISVGAAQDDGIANGGHLDNIRIEGPVYPEMYAFREQAEITNSSDPDYGDGYNMRYFRNSVIVYGGNVTISNCYISGSRTALCLRGGNNVVVENTTLSGGAYANMQICAGSTVILRNLTTVQVDVTDTYGQGKTMHGMGLVIDSNVVDVYIEGELKQYNWINETTWNKIVPSTYKGYFPKFFTDNSFNKNWHYLNGGTDPYVNMGLIFACAWDTDKIHDNRTTVDYGTTNTTLAGVSGGVYTKLNTVGGNAIADVDLAEPAYVSTGFNPVAPVLNFDNSPNADADDANDANDTYCVYTESTGTLKIGVSGSSKTLDLSQVTVEKNGTALAHTVYLNGTAVTGNSVTIKAADGAKQILTIKATSNDAGFDKDGNAIAGSIEYTWTVTVEVATLSYPAPVWNMGGDYEFDKTNLYYVYYSTSQGYGEAVPIYEGIKINYYDKNGTLVQKDFSGTTTHPTGSANSNSNAFTYTLSDGSTLVMKYSSGWKSGATTHQFATYSNKVYVYPQSLDNDNYVRAKATNQDFDVKITYTFTDPNGQSISQTMRWYNAKASNSSVSTVQWKTFDSVNGKQASICVTPDTLITMADGTQKQVRYVAAEDLILVWNFFNGEYAVVPAGYVMNHGYDNYTIVALQFADGTQVKTVNGHGFFDADINEFVIINASNVDSYVGHNFAKQSGDDFEVVQLVGYDVYEEYTESWSILSYKYYNCIVEGMLSITPHEAEGNFFMPFEVGANMTFDQAKMEADIATYGLYTYEEFADVMSKELFDALNMPYVKVAVGKGITSEEDIWFLLNLHFGIERP